MSSVGELKKIYDQVQKDISSSEDQIEKRILMKQADIINQKLVSILVYNQEHWFHSDKERALILCNALLKDKSNQPLFPYLRLERKKIIECVAESTFNYQTANLEIYNELEQRYKQTNNLDEREILELQLDNIIYVLALRKIYDKGISLK